MAMSERTLNQVRNILGKLDRSIDEARERRLGRDEPAEAGPSDISSAAAGQSSERGDKPSAPGSSIGHSSGPRAGSSPFGRAKPLQRPGSSTGRWS